MNFTELKKIKNQTEIMKNIKISGLDFADMEVLVNSIIPNCITKQLNKNFNEINFVALEMSKRAFILKECTDIEINAEQELTEVAEWALLIYDKIIKKIKNYDLFEKILDRAIEQEIRQFTNIEVTIKELIESVTKKLDGTDLGKIINKDLLEQLINQIPKLETSSLPGKPKGVQ